VQVVPFQHIPVPQAQKAFDALEAGAQPHAPTAHVSGKSVALEQHIIVVTVPPEAVHAAASPLSDEESVVSGASAGASPEPSTGAGASPEPSTGSGASPDASTGAGASPDESSAGESDALESVPPAMQVEPFQHPEAQLQTCTGWLDEGAQPQAPTTHMLGKSLTDMQHVDDPMAPPAAVQAAARPESDVAVESDPASIPPPVSLFDEHAIGRTTNKGRMKMRLLSMARDDMSVSTFCLQPRCPCPDREAARSRPVPAVRRRRCSTALRRRPRRASPSS